MPQRSQAVRPITWLQVARQDAGLTQDQLAHEAGISKVALSRIENGLREPREATKRCLAQELGFATEVLFPSDDTDPIEVLDARQAAHVKRHGKRVGRSRNAAG
jgi:transcriptional regulator with XRE-family HTH domain